MREIDHDAIEPVYRQLMAIIRAQIEAGELVPNRPIPSEETLSQRFGVSRSTVQKALRLLKAEGVLVSEHGRGTFVAYTN